MWQAPASVWGTTKIIPRILLGVLFFCRVLRASSGAAGKAVTLTCEFGYGHVAGFAASCCNLGDLSCLICGVCSGLHTQGESIDQFEVQSDKRL